MGFTAEGARAELERRKKLQNQYTAEGARAELERRREMQNSSETKGWKGVAEDIPEYLGDIAKGAGDFLFNLPEHLHQSHMQLNRDPGRYLRNLGQGGIDVLQGAFNLGPQFHNYLNRKDILDRPDAPILDIDITGGEQEQPGDILTRMLPGLLAGRQVGKAAAGKVASINPLASENIANKVVKGSKKADKISNKLFEKSIGGAEKAGLELGFEPIPKESAKNAIKNLKESDVIFKSLLEDAPLKTRKLLNEWLLDPNDWRRTHDLTKELGHVSKKFGTKGRPILEQNVSQAASEFRKQIIDQMHTSFNNAGRTDLSEGLLKANKHFQEHVLPHRLEPITEYMTPKFGKKRGMSDPDFIRALHKDPDFKYALGDIYPQVGRQQFLKKAGSVLGPTGVAGLALHEYFKK
jgi:hypothetical protein